MLDSRGRLVKWNGDVIFTWYDDVPTHNDFPTTIGKCGSGSLSVMPDFYDYLDDSCYNGPEPSSSGSGKPAASDASSVPVAAVILFATIAALIAALF